MKARQSGMETNLTGIRTLHISQIAEPGLDRSRASSAYKYQYKTTVHDTEWGSRDGKRRFANR